MGPKSCGMTVGMSMHLDVTWPAGEAELDTRGAVRVNQAVGFDAEELESVPGAKVQVAQGSFGKGAAGTGVALVLELSEHVLNDTASLIAVGTALRVLIARISQRRGRNPASGSPHTFAALAAAGTPAIADGPASCSYVRTVPLTTSGSAGTDMRDVWASTFENPTQGLLQVVFSSGTTRYLGTVAIGTEWYSDVSGGHFRSDAALAEIVDAWFTAE